MHLYYSYVFVERAVMSYNLLYIFADQLRYDVPGYAGSRHDVMPYLEELERECVNFTQAVSSNPVCGPYRACLFTGTNTTTNGMVINEIRMNPNQVCIGNVLTENGYKASYIGKWHLYSDELRNFYIPRNSFTPKGPHRLGFDDYWAAYGFSHTYYGELAFYHEDTPEKIYIGDRFMPDVQTDLLIKQLERHADAGDNFAVFLSYGTPHGPWNKNNVPQEYYDRFENVEYRMPENYSQEDDPHGDIWAHISDTNKMKFPEWHRIYDAMCANIDDNLKRITDALKHTGLDKNTVLVFTSDHGECWGAHGRRQKSVFYEEAARVPFLVRMPDGAHARRCDSCLSTVDIMPTLLELMEIPVPDTVEGMSLAPLINEIPDAPEPPFAFMQGTGSVAVYTDGYEWRAIRDKRYTYAVWRVDRSEHLYDNLNDPFQLHNLALSPEYKALLDDMRAKLKKKMDSIGDTFPSAGECAEKWIYNRKIWRSATRVFEKCPYDGEKPAEEPHYTGNGTQLSTYPLESTENEYSVEGGTVEIMDYAFYGAKALKRVKLPDTLKIINHGAFAESGIEEIVLPDGFEEIAPNAFYRCFDLNEADLPISVNKIHQSSFDCCPKLKIKVASGSFAEKYCKKYHRVYTVRK